MASQIIAGSPADAKTAKHQSGLIFQQIAELTLAIERMGVLLVDQPDDERDAEAFLIVIKALSAQAGFIAEMGCALNGASNVRGSDPAIYLLPPAFFALDDQQGECL